MYSVPMNQEDKRQLKLHREASEQPERRTVAKTNLFHKQVVEQGGGEYVPGMFGDLVLFNSKKTGSTLALPENLLTWETVRDHIAESNAKFAK